MTAEHAVAHLRCSWRRTHGQCNWAADIARAPVASAGELQKKLKTVGPDRWRCNGAFECAATDGCGLSTYLCALRCDDMVHKDEIPPATFCVAAAHTPYQSSEASREGLLSPARVRNNLGNDPYKVDLQFAFRQHSTPRRTIRLQCSVCKVFDFSSLFEQATGRFDRPNQDKSQKVLFPSTTTASEIRRRQDVVPLSKIHTMSFIVHLRRCWCSRSILPPPICHPRIAKPHQLQRTEWTPPTPPK